MFCPPGSRPYAEASAWFADLFDKSSRVGEEELSRAPDHSGELRPLGSKEVLDKLPLLERLCKYPQNFAGVQLAVADGYLDVESAATTEREVDDEIESDGSKQKHEVILQDFDGTFSLLQACRYFVFGESRAAST